MSLNMISANFRLESDLRGWFNLEPETPHGRFKLDLESPKRRPDSTSRPTPVPKRPRKEVGTCDKPAFESLLFILPISCYSTKPNQQIFFKVPLPSNPLGRVIKRPKVATRSPRAVYQMLVQVFIFANETLFFKILTMLRSPLLPRARLKLWECTTMLHLDTLLQGEHAT